MGVLPDVPNGPSMAQLASGEGGGAGLPADLQQLMENSDVTTIVGNVKTLAKTEIEQEATAAGCRPRRSMPLRTSTLPPSTSGREPSRTRSRARSTRDSRGAFLLVGACSLVGLALLALYREIRGPRGHGRGSGRGSGERAEERRGC